MTPAVTTLALAGPNAKNPGDWPCQFCKKVNFARDSPFECHLSQFSGSYPISRSILYCYVPFSGSWQGLERFVDSKWTEVISPAKLAGLGDRFQAPMVHPYLPLKRTHCNPQQDGIFFWGGETLDTWRITMHNVHMVFGLSFDIVDFITFLYTNFTAVSVDDFVSMTAWIWWFISATQRQWRKKSTTCKRFMKLVSAKRLMIKSIKETNQTPNNAKSGTIITVSQQW